MINDNKYIINEMKECFRNNNSEFYYADSTEYAIKLLSKYKMDKVIIDLNSISTAGLIKYINDNFKDIKVLLTAENQIEEAISVFKNGNYKLLSNPIKLQELKEIINH